eukprot:455811_1
MQCKEMASKGNKSWRAVLMTSVSRTALLSTIAIRRMPCTASQMLAAMLCVLLLCSCRTTFHQLAMQHYYHAHDTDSGSILSRWILCEMTDVHDNISAMMQHAKSHRNVAPSQIIDMTLFDEINDGDLICLPDEQIDHFMLHVFPNITSHFSLLSHSGTDRTFIARLPHKSVAIKLVQSQYLRKWFVTNSDGMYDKLEAIPLGIDFHTPWMKTGKITENQMNGLLKNKSLVEQNIDNRIRNKVYVGGKLNASAEYKKEDYDTFLDYFKEHKQNFDEQLPWLSFGNRFVRKYPYRTGLYSLLNHAAHDVWFIESRTFAQHELFERRSKYVFVLSPFGNGWDCFRTWEAIWFGHIVIVQSTAGKGVDDMFINHELPVVIVDNMDAFAEIDEEQLNKWYEEYKPLTYFENANTRYRMTNTYWINYMKDKTISLIP